MPGVAADEPRRDLHPSLILEPTRMLDRADIDALFPADLPEVGSWEERYPLRALSIERGADVANPRKDLRKWSDFRPVYGYFFKSLFQPVTEPGDDRLSGLDPQLIRRYCTDVLKNYRAVNDADEWFDQLRVAAAEHGFAANAKEHKRTRTCTPGRSAKHHRSSECS
jgi:glutamyl-tRNA synthetase